jgi:protein pelota
MIILKKDFKNGFASFQVSSSDDLWYLSHIISKNDKITMKSERKIKLDSGSDTNSKSIRKFVTMKLNVEEVNYNPSLHQLRVKGKIIEAPEDIPYGSFHTFAIELDSTFHLEKSNWPKYLQEKVLEASQNKDDVILIVVFDRESSLFSIVKPTGIEHLSTIQSDVQKKDMDSFIGKSNYDSIVEKISEYVSQYNPKNIICASPHFWKRYLEEKLPEKFKSKTIYATCGEVHKKVVNELMIRPELKQILASQRSSNELNLIELILQQLQKEKLCYGIKDVISASNQGAISEIAVTDNFILKQKEENKFEELDFLLTQINESNGKIHFIASEDASKTIDGLGGIVGILRWKLTQ